MSFFINNRNFVKGLAINTAASGTATYKDLCCASEITLNLGEESDDFYVFCDAIQRHVTTGLAFSIETTLKVDAENEGVQNLLSRIHTALASGTTVQLDNVGIQFQLLTGVTQDTLTYTTYTGTAQVVVDTMGGAAEDSGELPVTFNVNGTLTAAQ